MERAVAIKKLGKLLGSSLAYRVSDHAPNADRRAAARDRLTAALAERKTLAEAMEARRQAVLAADVAYQSLKSAHATASALTDKLSSLTRHCKFTVGTNNGLFFVVRAEGDSWEEVIAKLETSSR